MGVLAVLPIVGGVSRSRASRRVHHFLEPTFADSEFYETLHPSDSLPSLGLASARCSALLGIGLAYRCT